MIRTLEIAGYRGFARLTINGIARTNLIVGRNNCGKSSILEAISLVVGSGDPSSIYPFMSRRGEFLENPNRPGRVIDIRRLFHGHAIRPGTQLSIQAFDSLENPWIKFQVVDAVRDADGVAGTLFDTDDEVIEDESDKLRPTSMALVVEGSRVFRQRPAPISNDGGVWTRYLERPTAAMMSDDEINVQYVSADSWPSSQLASHWAQIVLTPDQELVEDALRLLDPKVERIAFVGSESSTRAVARRSAVVVKRKGDSMPIPIGSMGDGMWRMLTLAIALVRSADGFLLVDEIDTGLHHAVMESMWSMVASTASRLNVQIVATTHSLDCVRALSSICGPEHMHLDGVALHRVEQGKTEAIHYSEQQIVIAAERGIETR